MARRKRQPTEDQRDQAEQQIEEMTRRVEFYITEYSVELLARKLKDNEYVVPDYQRKFVWNQKRKSRFIESLIMGLPIPFLFFWEMPDGRLEIVDGSQRLRTIEEFVYGGLVLKELETLNQLNGMRFDDLFESRKRKINNRSIRGIVLNQKTSAATRLDMFDRINTGSQNAKMSEIRRGALAGPFMSLISEFGDNELLKKLAPITANKAKYWEHEELVTRFFAYSDGIDEYRDRPAEFHFRYVKNMNQKFEADPSLREEYTLRLQKVLEFVDRVFPYGFVNPARRGSTPRVRFESISLGVYLAGVERPSLYSEPIDSFSGLLDWLESQEYDDVVTSDGANSKARLKYRMEYVRDRLLGECVEQN